ncbi:LOW QUALITY PROTEIN: 17-beta-hydroxysteroid dehydrogenase type 3 [Cyanocitta cristata]
MTGSFATRVAFIVTELATDQKVKVMQTDFAKNSVYKNIEKDLKDLYIGVLVNSVGMLHNPLPCRFLNGQDIEEDLVNCNVVSVTVQCLRSRQKGLILNLSSGLSHFPCPLYTIYSATKAFISTFIPLQAEYKVTVIIIQVVIPYGASAPMTTYQNPGVITKTAEEFVTESLEYVTFGDEIFGYLAHEILVCILQFVPLLFHRDRLPEAVLHAFTGYLRQGCRNP